MKHATVYTNIATRIMDLWHDYDLESYESCIYDNGFENVKADLIAEPDIMLEYLEEIADEGTTEQATRAFAIIDAIERLN